MNKIRMSVGAAIAAVTVALTLGATVPTEAAPANPQTRPILCC